MYIAAQTIKLLFFILCCYVFQVRDFVQQNLFLAVGFGGGFLLGMAV